MDILKLKSSNLLAFSSMIIPFAFVVSGVYLSSFSVLWIYLAGQLILSIFFLQTFILLHECGHYSFFKSRFLNIVFGHVFGILTLIPFYTWQQMHFLHHIWTGWRDKDPTTEKTIEPNSSNTLRIIANISWRLYIPIFFISYKLSNYWNLLKIRRFLDHKKFRIALLNVILYTIVYTVLIYFFGYFILTHLIPAFFLSLVWKELVILTQHSHIEIPVSEGNEVRPISNINQVKYTRSFYINPVIAHYLLFSFNLHEIHHAYPGLSAYWLRKVDLGIEKKPKYFDWLKQAKSMKGEDYIFRTSKHTGIKF